MLPALSGSFTAKVIVPPAPVPGAVATNEIDRPVSPEVSAPLPEEVKGDDREKT